MEKGLLIEGIAKNVLVMLPKAKAIFKDTYGKKPQLNLRGIQILIINIIHNEGPMSMGKLSSIVSIAKANTTPLVADLIEKGYLCRRRYEKDRRVILIDLTEEGRQVQRMVQQENIAFFKSSIVGNIVNTVVHQDLHILEPVGSGCAHSHRIYFQAVCFKAGDHGTVFRRKAARLATEHAVIFVDGRLCPVDLDFLTI